MQTMTSDMGMPPAAESMPTPDKGLFGRKKAKDQWAPPDAAKIKDYWTKCVEDMLDIRRAFWLNTSYFHGDQWVGWNDSQATVTLLEFADASDSRYRTTVNKFKPRVTSMMARLLRTTLDFESRPGGVDDGALRRARIERQVLLSKHHRDDWELVRRDNLQNVLLGGVGAICIEPSWEFETEPIKDMMTGEEFHMPERPSIKLTALSPVEFGLEPGTRSSRDARWWMRCTTLTPAQAKLRYKLDKEPEADSDSEMTPMQRSLISNRNQYRPKSTATMVYTYYEKPSDVSPGCVVHMLNNKIVEVSPWYFDFKDRLNLRVFVQTAMGGTWKGDTMLNDARQLQKNYNRAYTSINAHIGKADNARMMVPLGSMNEDDELTGEAGEVIRYDASVGGEPHWMNAPQVPRWLREHIGALEMEMDDLFSTHAVTRGVAPGDRNSGLALSVLTEKDDTPLGLMAGDQQRGWQDIAEMVLRTERFLLMQASQQPGAPEMEVTDILPKAGPAGTPIEVRYRAQDISENPMVNVPLDSVLPKSQVAVQDMMLRLAQSFPQMFQSFGPGQLAAILQVPDPFAFTQVADTDIALAEWENGRMASGADDNEVEVTEWQDHDKHIQQHNRLRNSASYREADPQIRAYIDLHVQAHTQVAQEMMALKAQALAPATAPMQQQLPGMGGTDPTQQQAGPTGPGDPMAAMAAMASQGANDQQAMGAMPPQGGAPQPPQGAMQ